jgi:hypothetical protein
LTNGYIVALFQHSFASWRQVGWIGTPSALYLLITLVVLIGVSDRRSLQERARDYQAAKEAARREYQTVLAELALGEVRNQINLKELLSQMPGGTIGLAGPRGAGKTTLIRVHCPEEIYASRQSGDLALFVSAPVEYAPREFVLHLLATLCRAYLRFQNIAVVPDPAVPVPLIPVPGRSRRSARSAIAGAMEPATAMARIS